MSRRPRDDAPGSFHHVMNRAIARRTLFEDPDDIRRFLDCVGRAVTRGDLEVHAHSVLSTHFHFFVRSPLGRLSESFAVIQNEHVRRFNRRQHRDGPLVRGRFCSRRVDTLGYMVNVVRYIDRNPVEARLVSTAAEYPFGSARAYVLGDGPCWLRRDWVERLATLEGGPYSPEAYLSRFSPELNADERRAIELGLLRGNRRLARLGPVAAAQEEVRRHLARKARLADGLRANTPVVDATTLHEAIGALRSTHGPWTVCRGQHRPCGWRLLEIGLLRDWAGETQAALAERFGLTRSGARDACCAHRELLEADAIYAFRVGEVARALPPTWRTSVAASTARIEFDRRD